MSQKRLITLTTDFGLKDPFAGLMKGVIFGVNPDAHVIDLTHNIQRHNIFEATQTILMSYKYFPSSSIHVVVVDPGVGGGRRPLLVAAGDHYFIGPDNGVFTSIYETCQSSFFRVYHITASHYFLPMSGSTFHGRDIFAPVSAWLSNGVEANKFGDEIDDFTRISIAKPVIAENTLRGEIVSFDIFGNAISNISSETLQILTPEKSRNNLKITFNSKLLPLVNYYAENEDDNMAAIINSFGHIELFSYKNDACTKFDIKIGDSVIISLE